MVRFDLPWDLVEEILSRVSATSLRRLRFTCKRWNTLFKDPKFVKKHLAKPYSVLLLRCFRVYSLSVNINAIQNNVDGDRSIVFTSQLSRNLKSEEVEIRQVFHCNGLLLCSMNESYKTKLVVVNPCNGQTRWIKPRSVYHMFDRYYLGYENNNKHSFGSYKILRFPAGNHHDHLEIFELMSNSWRVLANIPLKVKQCTMGRGMSVKGNIYWLSCFLVDEFNILSFDLATERFRSFCLPIPFKNRMNKYNFIALSHVREEKLSVLHGRLDMKQMEIWMSKEIDTDHETVLSWTKSFIFDLHSDIDFDFLRLGSFFIDEEKKVIVSCGRINKYKKNMIYIFGEHDCRKFEHSTNQLQDHWPWLLFGYVPSLVSLNPPM